MMDSSDANYLKKIRERVNDEWDKVDGFHISDVAFLLRLLDEALARKHRIFLLYKRHQGAYDQNR